MQEDTIAAISTPIGEGGIGIVRLSGPDALKIADKIFVSKKQKRPSKYKTYTTHYGRIVWKDKIIDEVILTVMKAPGSYTREDVVEINCHGGIQALKKVLEAVVRCGARVGEPGEFTKRAFLNGRIDLVQAEAVLDTIRAKTEGSLKVAMAQLEGSLSKRINAVLDEMIEIASQIEASIDFPEEGLEVAKGGWLVKKIDNCLRKIMSLVDTYDGGQIFREGVLSIICGKPNTGKSSLMNLLLKRDRVIVSPIPGTTRDTVEEVINIKGIPIRLVDTAGIGQTEDALAREGMTRSKRYLDLADIVLLMLDASTGIGRQDLEIVKLIGDKKKIVIINKCDLAKKIDIEKIRRTFKKDKIVEISVKGKRNITALERGMTRIIWKGCFVQGEAAVVSNARHKELLDKAYGCMLSVKNAVAEGMSPELIAVDLRDAIDKIGLIVGRTISEDVLDRIFEQFCIGK